MILQKKTMFKLESYITPIILSYVDKYIKNFKPEDSQLSLWGGDVSFHNLDLRLEVLEQELQLPFSFLSGHIHELLIHVPWTKLASEPITITINTIECILKLRGEDSVDSDSASHAGAAANVPKDSRKKTSKRQDVEAPTGYMQSVVNKIVSNIAIHCNNLILKYVEEDIVLSVNVKTVTLQSANESWEPAFTELSPSQVLLRKVIRLTDLTICLDKRNASGKIEMYQEPLLYRCSLQLHLLRSYHSATAKRASVTRVDVLCEKMDFSLTEQQVPMLMRLALLALALHGKELRPEQSPNVEENLDDEESVSDEPTDATQMSWAGWAWSLIPPVPITWDENWSSDELPAYLGHTYHTGFYVDRASIALKVTESAPDRSYYGPRKVRFVPFLVMHLQGCFMDIVMHGAGWLNVQIGVSQATIEPDGDCFCGVKETDMKLNQLEDRAYLKAGSEQKNYMADSLFDPEATENRDQKRSYNVSWDYHVATVTEALLLEKTPAVAMDYLYMLELPEDFNSEHLSELGSDLEYSNFSEKSLCRLVVGPTAFKVCSGLFHRLQMLQHSGKFYDYSPYSIPKPEPSREQLRPASAEDFESLDNNIPKQVYQVTFFKPVIHIHLADHPVLDTVVLHASRKRRRKSRIHALSRHLSYLPKVTLECQCLDARLVKPMYPRRLVSTTCQLPVPPQHMFHACHIHTTVNLLGLSSHLVLGTAQQTMVLNPSNFSYAQQNLLIKHYWNNADIIHKDHSLKTENLTVTCTKAKLMAISNILQSEFDPALAMDIIQNSTLLADASKHTGVDYLELCVEDLNYRQVIIPGSKALTLSLGSVKAFIQEFPLKEGSNGYKSSACDVFPEPRQALVLSGPESSTNEFDVMAQPLLCLTVQWTRTTSSQDHPPVLMFNLREVHACLDPMMWRWLRYAPERLAIRHDSSVSVDSNTTSMSTSIPRRSRKKSSEASHGMEMGPARRASTPQESVHSSSDRDQMVPQTGPTLSPVVAHSQETQPESVKQVPTSAIPEQESTWSRTSLLHWFPVWQGLILSGDVAQCVVYLPTASLSAVGSQSIEEALAQCLHVKTALPPEVLVVTFPVVCLRSAAQKQGLHQYTSRLPVKLPENIWTANKNSFPWSLALTDLSCYTWQNGTKLHFLKPVSANATIGISTKHQSDGITLASLGFCVHVDIKPVNVSMSQDQIKLMANILVGLLEFTSSLQFFTFASRHHSSLQVDPPTPVSPTVFPESSESRESMTTPLETQESSEQQSGFSQHSDAVKMTVWMQSTLARVTISLYAVNLKTSKDDLKLTLDMEDIMTSLDLQQVYLKVKCKVAYANILHYIRKPKSSTWILGPYVGLVMRVHEDHASSPPHSLLREADDSAAFLSVTYTRAKCRNVHSRWGTRKQATLLASDSNTGSHHDITSAHYISEIVLKLQAVDFVFSAATLSGFLTVLYPILMLPEPKHTYMSKSSKSKINWTMEINNSNLPLLYLDTRSIRILLPASNLTEIGETHDVCLLQLETITLTSQAENPLSRVVVRSDIYQMAEQAHMLGVPGSQVEDRQYQLDVTGFSMNTGTWGELDKCFSLTSSRSSSLRTMSENPALEWNNLRNGSRSIRPHMSLSPVISRLNLCIVAAPAIVYQGDILVCGHSLEVNAVTDIEVSVSTGQLLLASSLFEEVLYFFKPILVDSGLANNSFTPDAPLKTLSEASLEIEYAAMDYNRFVDSGVDVADASSASVIERGRKPLRIPEKKGTDLKEENQNIKEAAPSKRTSSTKPHLQWCNSEQRVHEASVPVEILLTAGKVSCLLYETLEGESSEVRHKRKSEEHSKTEVGEDMGYEAGSEEGSVEDVIPSKKHVKPLFYIVMAQPHTFMSRLSFTHKIQVSCFDLSIRASEPHHVIPRSIPRTEDFPVVLLETKGGDPHPDTGIPPAFLTIRWTESIGKAPKIDVEVGRPTKVSCSISQWNFFEDVQQKMKQCFHNLIATETTSVISGTSEPLAGLPQASKTLSYRKVNSPHEIHSAGQNSSVGTALCDSKESRKSSFMNRIDRVADISLASQQVVFQVSGMKHGTELVLSLAGFKGSLSRMTRGQVDRVAGSVNISCLMLTTVLEGTRRTLLRPWSCTTNVCLAWEPWLLDNSFPQVQLTADSESVFIDIGPDHLQSLQLILSEYKPFLKKFEKKNSEEKVISPSYSPDQDQHYHDDLRAGAFQFVDASAGLSREDLPLPYQVVFWQSPPTMAWRYPQPRALTRVDVFPVPFKVATDHRLGREPKDQVLCSLQYWSSCRSSYQPYTQFQLSESEMCRLELPSPPHQVVSCTWRVQLFLQSEEENEEFWTSSHVLISPRALAACMRIDSFFTPCQVPCIEAAVNISSLQVSLYNHMMFGTAAKPFLSELQQFSLDHLTPESQLFMSFTLDNSSLYMCTWSTGGASLMELTSRARCDVIDYAYLTQHCLIEPFPARVQLTLSDVITLSCVTKPIGVRFGPAIGHTLAVSAHLWIQAFQRFEQEKRMSTENDDYQIIISRYVICNDMTRPLRFGQVSTDEDILLGSRQCHFYAWRSQKAKFMLRIGVEEGAWVWSQPFSIDVDGLQLCGLADCGVKDISIIVKVSSLSATQKQVTLSGQLVVTNLLAEILECRIVPAVDETTRVQADGQNLIALGKSTTPSVLLDVSCKMALRIRFHGVDGGWSGDIPLRENSKSGQPWLVKVPLHDRSQFLSVWCRILCQNVGRGVKILAMLCPLYMIRSHLPVPARVLIETPGLKVHLQSTVDGRGEEQQLYCPGTVDHSHKLTFQVENGIPPSNPYVPLSYTMIDQRKFFKMDSKDVDIDIIISSINGTKTSVWPFIGEEYANVTWEAVEQPETQLEVNYIPLGPYCSTLLVELEPWALLVNVLGCSIVLLVEDRVVSRIPHQGVLTPPKLEHTFNLGLEVDEEVYPSPPFHLARLDQGSSFYMPRISGLIPDIGDVQSVVHCRNTVSFLSVSSVIVEKMRVLNVRANYVICNRTSVTLQVSALAVRGFVKQQDFHKETHPSCIQRVLPDVEGKNNLGWPVVHWMVLGEEDENEAESVPYIILNSGSGWSCPLRVNDGVVRRSFTIPKTVDDSGQSNSAYILTVREHSGQIFLSVFPEQHPQINFHNMCRFKIMCAQGTPENNGTAVQENTHFNCWNCIEPYTSGYYSLPAASEKFPDIVPPGNWPLVVLALPGENTLSWSRGISITESQEQFVRLPGYGDVKVRVEIRCHTTHITVDTVSQVEISARDIRSRLLHHQKDVASSPMETHSQSVTDYRCVSYNVTEPIRTETESSRCITTSPANSEHLVFIEPKTHIYEPSDSPSLNEFLEVKSETQHINFTCFLRGLHITLTEDIPKARPERTEVIVLSLDNVCVSMKHNTSEDLDICISIGDLQLDNQMFPYGGFDFPVILISQVPKQHVVSGFSLSTPASSLIDLAESLIAFNASLELSNDNTHSCTAMKNLSVSIGPLCAYIEDTLITKLTDYLLCLLPPTLIVLSPSERHPSLHPKQLLVSVPKAMYWDSRQVAFPLRLCKLTIQPVSLLLSVHSSVKMYIALDHSPLQFSMFERHRLITTPYRLGHTLTMHYLSGAIFSGGWVVGSLELLGSPGGFARTLGTGLRDFVSLPYRGFFEGPWGFLIGVTHGSASLMKHVTAGTLSSVTKLAASVARNLDRLTLDKEHLARTEELRRQRPQGVTQGLVQGLTGLGISLLGAVGGLAHHSLQSVISEGASTRGLVAGVGLGLVGAITKPLSGAAGLVALTGQGLLHGAGWTSLPEARQQPTTECAFTSSNSDLKYNWKLISGLEASHHILLHVAEATFLTATGSYEAITLVLTTRALFLVDTEEDMTRRVLSLAELSGMDHPSDPTLLCFHLQSPLETDAASHARVVDFVRHSSGMVIDGIEIDESSSSGSPVSSEPVNTNDTPLTCFVNPQTRNYFLSVLGLAKRQNQGLGFAVL